MCTGSAQSRKKVTSAAAHAARAAATHSRCTTSNIYILCMLRSILKKKNFNAHPPIRALQIPQDEREDVIPSDLEYPYCEVAKDPFKGALTG